MFKSLAECTTADKHGYCIIADERHKVITLLGQQVDVSHGTPSRAAWNMVRNNPQGRAEYLKQMFGRNDPELGRILDKIPAVVGESLEEGWKEKVAAGVLGATVLGGGAAIQYKSKEWARKNPELAAEIEKAAAKERQTAKPINFSNNPYSNGTVPDLNDPTNNRFKLRNLEERGVEEGTTMNKPQGPRQMDPEELDSLVTSIGQKAKQGQMKTVWVPDQHGKGGRYKVVPVTDAPVEEDAAPMSREDYMARRKSLQQLQMDPKVTRDPAVRKELIKKIAQLTMQARSAGVLPESVYAAHVQENRLFEARAIVNTIKYLKESAVEEGVVDHISHAYKGVKRAVQGKPSKIDVELKHRKKALGHSMDQIDDLANFITSRGSKQANDQFNSTQAKHDREVARANKVEKLGPKK
jgi:hypothetical protein